MNDTIHIQEPLLEVKDLKVHFEVTDGFFGRENICVKAVDGVNLSVNSKETLGVVGESGCGKTTLSRAILLLIKPSSGSIHFKGQVITSADKSRVKEYRRAVQAVFQDPTSSLNPRMRVREIISEPLIVNSSLSKGEVNNRLIKVMRQMGLSSSRLTDYPHEFSGGQRQRIAVARALITGPELIILDEPVSALDVSVRAQMLNLLRDIQDKSGIAYIMIAHDLAAVQCLSTTILVMYLGKVVEIIPSSEITDKALHPYTRALLSAVLPNHPSARSKEIILKGEVPSPLNVPPGCWFHPRCDQALPLCQEAIPALKEAGSQHRVACHLY